MLDIKLIGRLMLYSGVEKEEFASVRCEISENNRTKILGFSLVSIFFLIVVAALTYFSPDLGFNHNIYLVPMFLLSTLYLVTMLFAKNKPNMIKTLIYIFMSILFLMAIYIGTFASINQTAGVYLAFIMVLPLIFVLTPLENIALIVFYDVLFTIIVIQVKNPSVIAIDILDSVIFSILSFVVSTMMLRKTTENYVIKNKINQEKIELESSRQKALKALGSVYERNLLVHVESGKVEWLEIPSEEKEKLGIITDFSEVRNSLRDNYLDDEYKKGFDEFTSLETINERLSKERMIKFIYLDKRGSWKAISALSQSRDEYGDIKDLLFVVRNVTEEKQKEMEYQRKLEISWEKERRANDAKTNFLKRISHDIKTPINGIQGMLALSELYLDDKEKQKEYREKIRQSSEYLFDLASDVLDMTMLESGEVELEHNLFDIHDLIDKAISLFEFQAKNKNIELSVEKVEVEHPYLIGSCIHLERIGNNIIDNAIKFTDEGGKVTLGCREKRVDGDKVFVEFWCRDNGRGMDQRFIDKAFEAFSQEDEEDARTSYKGTGLGLTLSKELVEKMNGSIAIESKIGKGTCVTFTLPFEIGRKDCESPYSEEEIDLSGIRVLVAEDNEINMEVVDTILGEKGCIVTKAWNGKEAVDIFKSSKEGDFQIILMDLMMPVMDGYQATLLIRDSGRSDSSVPIIAVSANTFTEDKKKTKAYGMDYHLPKPLDMELLFKVIKKYTK